MTGHYGVGVLLESCLADNLAFVERTRRLIRKIIEVKVTEKVAARSAAWRFFEARLHKLAVNKLGIFRMTTIHKKVHWAQLYRRALFEGDRKAGSSDVGTGSSGRPAEGPRIAVFGNPGPEQEGAAPRPSYVAAHYLGLLRSLEAQQHWVCL